MSLPLTSTFASITGLLVVALAFVVVIKRARSGHAWGDGGDSNLHRAIRAHAHLVEYAPMFLLLTGLLELHGAKNTTLWALGAAFFVGRVSALLYSFVKPALALRVVAFWLSALPIVVPAALLLVRTMSH